MGVKELEKELNKEHQLFKWLINTHHQSFIRVNSEGGIIFINEHAEDLLGFESNIEKATLSINDLEKITIKSANSQEEKWPFFKVLLAREPLYNVQVNVNNFRSGKQALSINAFPLFGEGDKIEEVVFYISEITEFLKQPNQPSDSHLLEENFKFFKSLFEKAGIGIIISDNEGAILETNKASELLFSYAKEEFHKLKIRNLLIEDTGDEIAIHNTSDNWRVEKRFISKDKRAIWGCTTIFDVRGDSDNVLFKVYIVEDITELKLMEEKLQKTERFLHSISENISDGIYRTSSDGIEFVNHSFANLFGYDSVEEVMSVPIERFYAIPQQRRDLLKKVQKEGRYKNEEILFLRKDGSTFYGLDSAILTRDDQGNIHFDGAIMNISHHKHSEELLKNKNKELKKINEELDRFVYSVSHDLRAPLTSIMGLLNLSEADKNPENIRQYLEYMRGCVNNLDKFMQDILDYSRNSRLEVLREKVALKEMISSIFETFRFIPNADKIKVNVEVDERCELQSDSGRLRIVLNNLISNAIKYHNYLQDTPFIEVKVECTEDRARISIKDNGKGIGKEHLDNIFNMFYRASISSKGSGLGLYIVKETLGKLKGNISVESEIGKGTTFYLEVPNLAKKAKVKANVN